jgi:hypothetical protein
VKNKARSTCPLKDNSGNLTTESLKILLELVWAISAPTPGANRGGGDEAEAEDASSEKKGQRKSPRNKGLLQKWTRKSLRSRSGQRNKASFAFRIINSF